MAAISPNLTRPERCSREGRRRAPRTADRSRVLGAGAVEVWCTSRRIDGWALRR